MTASDSTKHLRTELPAFMAGGEFMPLWRAVMEVAGGEDVLEPEQVWFDALYELVYSTGPDPVDESDSRHGIIGANQLRDLILAKGLHLAGPA